MDATNKRFLRRKIKNMRLALSEMEKAVAADSIFTRLESLAPFMMAQKILMYHSLPDEVETHRFLKKWSGRKKFFLPRVNGVNLEILPYEESRLELGSFHIEEPTGEEVADPSTIELVIVPAVAYDSKGNRLGRGKGYYDRLLPSTRATKIGVAYQFQMLDEIPAESHDVPVDIVITDTDIYITRK